MRGGSLCLLLMIIILTITYVKSCKYWCKMGNRRYYCCPNGKSESWFSSWFPLIPWFWFDEPYDIEHSLHEMIMKLMPKKHCPPLRTYCPRTYDEPPNFCEDDHECDESEKCCYDVCLEHKTCKNAE